MDRQQAWDILCEYTKTEPLRKHGLAVEAAMRAYAKKYGADWTFLTGSPANIMTTLQAFDAYRGNKVNHFALNIMRPAGDEQWTRVEGLTSAAELARVWRNISL